MDPVTLALSRHGTGRGATVVVAAADTPLPMRRNADFVCDGVDDQDTINAAVALLNYTGTVDVPGRLEGTYKNQGGTVKLLGGSYHLTGPIDLSGINDLTLSGDGSGTVIYNASTDGSHAIQAINTNHQSNKSRTCVRDLMVVGNPQSGSGVHLEDGDYQHVLNVFSVWNGAHGIHIVATTERRGAENKVITNCQCLFNQLDGIRLEDNTHETLITGCHLEENYRYNLSADFAINLHISNCSIEDSHGPFEVYLTRSAHLHMSNTIVEGPMYVSGADNFSYTTYITNCEVNDGFYYIGGSSGGVLNVSNSQLTLRRVEGSEVLLNNCVLMLGPNVHEATSEGHITTTNVLSIVGGTLRKLTGAFTFEIRLGADNARASLQGVMAYNMKLRIVNAGTFAGTRCLLSNLSARAWSDLVIDGLSHVSITDGHWFGTGSATFDNVSGSINVSGNVLNRSTWTVNNTCSGKIAFLKNIEDINVTVTDHTGTAVIDNL